MKPNRKRLPGLALGREAGRVCLYLLPLFAAPLGVQASSDSALNSYKKGDFPRARAEFERLARQKPADPRLRFNAGDAAYRQQDFTNATAHFESVLGAPDLKLQEQAYYNLGNARYQLGAKTAEPQARLQAWQQSLTNFGSAVKLDPQDTNALSNLSFVQRQVEELMKQMPKQPQKNQNQDDQKPSQKKQDPSDPSDPKPDQQSKEEQNQPGSSPDQASSPKSQQAQNANEDKPGEKAQSPEAKREQQQAKAERKDAEKQARKEPGSEAGQKSPGSAGEAQPEESGKPGEMSTVQAERMLDDQKGGEKALVFQAAGNGKDASERPRRKRKAW